MVMALAYLDAMPSTPEIQGLIIKIQGKLTAAYERLIGFRVQGRGGYDWFGKAPAHDALCAYGLM